MMPDGIVEIAAQLLAAGIMGGLIGFERRVHHKAIGIAGMVMIAIGSTTYMLLATHLAQTDPSSISRTLQGFLSGIGFLGGAVIFKSGFDVKGINPDSPDEMAFGQLCAPISAVKSNSDAGSSSRIPTDPTGERRNWQFRQRFRGLRSCQPNPCGESGLMSLTLEAISQKVTARLPIEKSVYALILQRSTSGARDDSRSL